MKKIICICLVTLFICSSIVFADVFSDLPTTHWAYQPIMQMMRDGILNGYPDGSFKPNNDVTRAEFVKILVEALHLRGEMSYVFDDVSSTHWANKYIKIGSKFLAGYSSSGGKTLFMPSDSALREDVAVAMVLATGLENKEYKSSSLNVFSDKDDISNSVRKYIAIAVENKLIRGFDDGTFKPKEHLTRAQVCQLIKNASELPNISSKDDINEDILITIKDEEGNKVKNYDTLKAYLGQNISIGASSDDEKISKIEYRWDNGETTKVSKTKVNITIPDDFEPGSTHILKVTAIGEDGSTSEEYSIKVQILDKETKFTFKVLNSEDKEVKENDVFKQADKIKISVKVDNNKKISCISYSWDGKAVQREYADLATIIVPDDALNGSTHTLEYQAVTNDSISSHLNKITIKIAGEPASTEPTEPTEPSTPSTTEEDKLIITSDPANGSKVERDSIFFTVDGPNCGDLEFYVQGIMNETIPEYKLSAEFDIKFKTIYGLENPDGSVDVTAKDYFVYTIKVSELISKANTGRNILNSDGSISSVETPFNYNPTILIKIADKTIKEYTFDCKDYYQSLITKIDKSIVIKSIPENGGIASEKIVFIATGDNAKDLKFFVKGYTEQFELDMEKVENSDGSYTYSVNVGHVLGKANTGRNTIYPDGSMSTVSTPFITNPTIYVKLYEQLIDTYTFDCSSDLMQSIGDFTSTIITSNPINGGKVTGTSIVFNAMGAKADKVKFYVQGNGKEVDLKLSGKKTGLINNTYGYVITYTASTNNISKYALDSNKPIIYAKVDGVLVETFSFDMSDDPTSVPSLNLFEVVEDPAKTFVASDTIRLKFSRDINSSESISIGVQTGQNDWDTTKVDGWTLRNAILTFPASSLIKAVGNDDSVTNFKLIIDYYNKDTQVIYNSAWYYWNLTRTDAISVEVTGGSSDSLEVVSKPENGAKLSSGQDVTFIVTGTNSDKVKFFVKGYTEEYDLNLTPNTTSNVSKFIVSGSTLVSKANTGRTTVGPDGTVSTVKTPMITKPIVYAKYNGTVIGTFTFDCFESSYESMTMELNTNDPEEIITDLGPIVKYN